MPTDAKCRACNQPLEEYDDSGFLFECLNTQCQLWSRRFGSYITILLKDEIAEVRAKEVISKNIGVR